MESSMLKFESTDITFHSRDLRPTQSLERAKEKARKKGSDIVRIYGNFRLIIDPETMLVYPDYHFSEEITKKIKNGELVIKPDTPKLIDEETQKKMIDKEKRKLKNSTKVWRANN
jgi:hypothetical protein